MCDDEDKEPEPRSRLVRLEERNVLDDPPPRGAFTICLSGTGCTRDEGEASRDGRLPDNHGACDKDIYCDVTGYIPVRIHREISGSLHAESPSITVRGVGENDWANNRESEPLVLDGPLNVPDALIDYCSSYSGRDQFSMSQQTKGQSVTALALHAANLAASEDAERINLLGHSRGGVAAIMAAWFLYAYGSPSVRRTPVNIFAIDPVPGPGNWYSCMTQLAPNVAYYVGVYAWDMCSRTLDGPFQALVPRPNKSMGAGPDDVDEPCAAMVRTLDWKELADNAQRQDPLAPSDRAPPQNYELFASRGRHGTVAGNATSNGDYDPKDVAEEVKPVPKLVYRMARGYLSEWGVRFPQRSAVEETALFLRHKLNTDHRLFDAMGGGSTRTSTRTGRPWVRRISSISGRNPFNNYYFDNVVGDPPYTMAYPVTNERTDAGWAKWRFL
jgi:hypothetical protein